MTTEDLGAANGTVVPWLPVPIAMPPLDGALMTWLPSVALLPRPTVMVEPPFATTTAEASGEEACTVYAVLPTVTTEAAGAATCSVVLSLPVPITTPPPLVGALIIWLPSVATLP